MNIKIFKCLLNKFILWLKKIFHIRPEPTEEKPREGPRQEEKPASPEEEPTGIKPPEKKIPQITPEKKIEVALPPKEKPPELLSEKEPVEAKPTEGITPEVPPEQKIPSESPPEASEEEITPGELEKISKTKTRKPYKKKAPTEERKKEDRKPSGKEKRLAIPKPTTEIDLGKRKKQRPTKQLQQQTVAKNERTVKALEGKEISIRVEAPYVEIDLDESKILLIIPNHQFKINTVNNIPQQLHYKLELNGHEQTISAKVSSDKQNISAVEEKKIDLEQPLKNFKISYPDELQGRVYSYQHSDEILYPFIAIRNNRGRMHYLYDEKGNFNPLPRRDICILLKEDFDLATEPDLIDGWIWERYQSMCINLKNTNELIIKNRQTGEEEKIPCESAFSIEGDELVEDDFKEQNPLFVGKIVKIKAPMENPSGWIVWIQNRQAGYKIISENWTGDTPLELKLPDDLPCECGEFQVDICEQEDRIPIETLFFRYIPSLQLKFPRELIILEPNIGHKKEIIKILLERDFQDFELKVDEKFQYNNIENGYQVDLLPEQDTVRFSLVKKGKPETETSFRITIPRLKWRTSINETWCDKSLQLERNRLVAGTDFYLTVCTNDFDTKYDLSAILEINGQRLQEAKFIRKGMEYNLLLNQFYDTIKKNEDKITLRMEIRKAKNERLLNQVDVIHFPKITKEKASAKTPKQPVSFTPLHEEDIKNLTPNVRGGSRKLRKGKGFSRQEVSKAGMDMNVIRRLHIPFDHRRKTAYLENIEILKSLRGGE